MDISICKQLTAILLLVAVLWAPLNSLAHDATSEASKETCDCLLWLTDCGSDRSGEESDQYPGNDAGKSCNSEESFTDAAEPAFFCNLRLNISVNQLSCANTHGHIPEVYLAIFVPPEN
jgi:hypothetical protein